MNQYLEIKNDFKEKSFKNTNGRHRIVSLVLVSKEGLIFEHFFATIDQ
jgi:hypothetical protein